MLDFILGVKCPYCRKRDAVYVKGRFNDTLGCKRCESKVRILTKKGFSKAEIVSMLK